MRATVILAALRLGMPSHPAGCTTQGLRNSPDSRSYTCALDVASASGYSAALEGAQILLGVEQRSETIWEDTLSAAAEVGGTVPSSAREDLLQEVTHLVESPRVLQGQFSADFLRLPRYGSAALSCFPGTVPSM